MEEDPSPIWPSFARPIFSMPDFNSIPRDKWDATEAAICEVMHRISPTDVTEDRRSKVIDYIQQLIYNTVGVQIFPYGSVPLKTYLPEGDIDLTAISFPGQEEALVADVSRALSAESENINAEFEMRDVNMINAEVKLVKCIVGGIIMDISFNQLGGLCSLGFLERIDRHIAQDHLFKRSILLIKAWCYYESHVVGAIHGLMSTYALEVLVLYIFHMYRESLKSPLMVLYRFLDYYNTFDWQEFCISLDGPASVSSLPNIIVDNPIHDSVLGGEFLKSCQDVFNVPSREGSIPIFARKFLNIVDPLKDTNNLGRSIFPGAFYRIQNGLRFGARKLGEIMELQTDKIEVAVTNFFKRTLQEHQSRYNPLCPIPLRDLSTVPDMVVVEWELDLDYKSEDDFDDTKSETSDDGPTEGWCSGGKVVPTYEGVKGLSKGKGVATLGEGSSSQSVKGVNKPEKELTILFQSSEPKGKGLAKGKAVSTFGEGGDQSKKLVKNLENKMNVLCKENEELIFSKFSGDYDGYVRNLVYGLLSYCFAIPGPLFHVPDQPIPYGDYGQYEVGDPSSGPWVPQNQSWSQRYPYVAPMQPGTHLFDHGTGTHFPAMGSPTRGRGWGRGPATPHRQPRRGFEGMGPALSANHEGQNTRQQSPTSPGHSGARTPNQLSTRRRLQFGSFGATPNTGQNVESSQPERGVAEPLKLKDDEEFPPLSG